MGAAEGLLPGIKLQTGKAAKYSDSRRFYPHASFHRKASDYTDVRPVHSHLAEGCEREEGANRDLWGMLQTHSSPGCRQAPGLQDAASVSAGSAAQDSLGFCSSDCLIWRSFKHVRTVDSRAALLYNGNLSQVPGKGESGENQT